ncbi:hypothetical protein [Comamonas odontotermitis]|uniref:hypothetical protein n=1 Tax=Comamonas odontotermitis TaxID=379895 RepID=UPI001CC65A3A|nr:hypothetical protein [Comamonas odontotermitis]UBB16169.1 hypothetical protein LAD35_15260 [Comamonas odontotermitis]
MTQQQANQGAPAEKTQLLPSAIKPASSVPAGAMPSVDDLPLSVASECEEANIDYKPPASAALFYECRPGLKRNREHGNRKD